MPDFLTAWELGGVLLTVVAAVYAYTHAAQSEKKVASLNITVLGVLLTAALSIRFDLLPTIDRRHALDNSSRTEGTIEAYLEALQVGSQSDVFLLRTIQKRAQRFSDDIENARDGRYVIESHELGSFSTELIASAQDSIVATSYVDPSQFWGESWGQQYLEQNKTLVGRGVSVTRYFIVKDSLELRQMRPLMEAQAEMGVEVFVVQLDKVDYRHQADLIIVDGVTSGKLTLTTDRQIVEAVMSIAPKDIREARDALSSIRAVAVPVKKPTTGQQR